ncbi:MAG TPA: DUF2167 domain-containing protein [Methylomirabilota bacterium]|jgi:uncharacterized membrane-anchored protein|nr:DUF2167 domain-containing protein [Methylomirabilota bacterium]
MRRNQLVTIVVAGLLCAISPASAATKASRLAGPAKASLGDRAQIDVPVGYDFFDGNTTRALMKASGEPTSGDEMGCLMPTNSEWSVLFEFDEIGFVKDDEKDKLDADKILASIKKGTAQANKERVRSGNAPLEIVGWEVPPRYDPTTHNLEWAIRATSEGKPILNYNTRMLGRKGVMEVVLIVEPDKLSETLPTFRGLLANYNFQTGQTYAEYRSGDKVAKYGLAALVVGGAAVGAAKLGLFTGLFLLIKKGWKLVIVAFAAVAAALKKFFAKIFGGRQTSS